MLWLIKCACREIDSLSYRWLLNSQDRKEKLLEHDGAREHFENDLNRINEWAKAISEAVEKEPK